MSSEDSGFTPDQVYNRNRAFLAPGAANFNTQLTPDQEQKFRAWVKQNNVAFDPNDKTPDYDMRGFYSALQSGDARAKSAVGPNDNKIHYPDYWKTPYDATFSKQSKWANKATAPDWNENDQLVLPNGHVIFDDKSHTWSPLDPPKAAPSQMAPGQQTYNKLLDGGFSAQEAQQWKAEQTAKLRAGGFSQPEIDNYWGEADKPTPVLDRQITSNISHNWTPDQARQGDPNSFVDSLAAGWNMSATSLAKHAPRVVAPEHQGFWHDLAYSIGQFAGDLPFAVTGGAVGAGATSETGPGAVIGAGAGAAALPEAIRQVQMDAYENGDLLTSKDMLQRAAKLTWNTTKAALVGGVSSLVGGKVGAKVLEKTGSQVAANVAEATGFTTAATTTSAGLDKRLPDASDFGVAAATMLGAHIGMKAVSATRQVLTDRGEAVAANMRGIYAKTGIPPWEQAQRAQTDPVLRQEIMATTQNKTPASANFMAEKPPEPEPYSVKAYHGTASDFQAYDLNKAGEATSAKDATGATFFTDSPEIAGHYADFAARDSGPDLKKAPGEGANIRPVKLTFTNPKEIDWEGQMYSQTRFKSLIASAKAAGHDGVIIKNVNDDVSGGQKTSTVYAAFHPNGQTQPHFGPADQLDIVRHAENTAGYARAHGLDENSVVSSAGAVGRYQVTPDTARAYGFDPAQLHDPIYNEKAARAIIADLSKKYRLPDGSPDMEAILIAYNAGPGRANKFLAHDRDASVLPAETQRYLERADQYADIGYHGTGGGGRVPPGGGGEGVSEPPEPNQPRLPKPNEGQSPFDLNAEMLTSKINDVIANPVRPSLLSWLKDQGSRFNYEAVSELAPAERLDAKLGISKDDVGVADMFRQTYGASGRAYHMLNIGGLDPVSFAKTDAPPLMSAYKNAQEVGSIEEFRAVRQARRTVELADRGMKTSTDVDTAKALLEKVGHKYDDAIEIAQKANDAKIDYYRDSGMLSMEGAQKLKADNRDWYPQIPEKEAVAAARKGSRFGPSQRLKKAEGHENQIVDPSVQEIKSYYSIASIADKNRAVAGLVNALKPEDMEALGIRLLPDKTTKPELFDKDGNLIPEVMDNKGAFELKGNQFAYFENGVRKVYETDDPQLADMIRGRSPIQPDQSIEMMRWFAKLKRSGITDMPDFIARAMMKDALGASILTKWGGVPFLNTFRGLFHIPIHMEKADAVFQEFVANGGLGAAISDMDANWVQRDLHRMEEQTSTLKSVINTVSHPLEAAQLLMQRMDAATRIGVYKNAQAAGLPKYKAAIEARKATLDFQEKAASQVVNLMAGIVPFYRPSILGLKQVYQAFTERPMQTGAKSLAYIALPTALLYALNYAQDKDLPEDEKFANLPRWQKDTMFILPSIDGVRIRLPMPPLLGTLVGGLTNRILDHFAEKDPRAFKDWTNTMIAQFLPPIVPAAVLPIYEHMANYNSFQDRPLIPSSLEGASGYMQYQPSTTDAAKQIARVLGPPNLNLVDVSPIVIDNYVREWTGALGPTVLRILDAPFADDGKPHEFADNPFIGSFAVRHPGTSAAPITDFYDEYDKVTTAHRDLKLAVERQDQSLIQFTSSDVKAMLNLNEVRQALNEQRSAIDAITANKDMKPEEKRQFIDNIYSGMIQTAKAGLATVDAINGAEK